MNSTGKVSGHFTIFKYNSDTGELVETRDFDNLITTFGLQKYCEVDSFFGKALACVGVGTTEPTVDDTTLESLVAVSNTSYYGGSSKSLNTPQAPDYISTVTDTVRFNAGTFNGTNLTEVGVCAGDDSANGYRVWCRALILDEQGQPSSITVLSNEYLDVRYVLRFHPDLSDGNFSFEMDGVTYNCTTRVAFANENVFKGGGYGTPLRRHKNNVRYLYNSAATLGEVTGQPIFSTGGKIDVSTNINSGNNLAWSSENPYSIFTQQTLPMDKGNFSDGNGIGAMVIWDYYAGGTGIHPATQVKIEPPLPKDSSAEFTFVFGQTIGRWEPPTP